MDWSLHNNEQQQQQQQQQTTKIKQQQQTTNNNNKQKATTNNKQQTSSVFAASAQQREAQDLRSQEVIEVGSAGPSIRVLCHLRNTVCVYCDSLLIHEESTNNSDATAVLSSRKERQRAKTSQGLIYSSNEVTVDAIRTTMNETNSQLIQKSTNQH